MLVHIFAGIVELVLDVRSAPSQRMRLGLPWVPIARITFSASTVSPFASAMAKAPCSPVIAFTSALSMTLTPCSGAVRSQAPSTASRLPASNGMSDRSTSCAGVAMTCLPFWYL
jgi:hypothetical protein